MGCQNNCNRNKNEISSCIDQLPLTMCYVPMQGWNRIYDLGTGFQKGTIFPELDKPFYGARRDCSCRK